MGEGASQPDSVTGAATAGGKEKENTRREATVAAARSKTHHATCSTVSFKEAFLHDKGAHGGGVVSARFRGETGSKGVGRMARWRPRGMVFQALPFFMLGVLRARVYGGLVAKWVV